VIVMAIAAGSLRIVATSALYMHEATEPERVNRVAAQLLTTGCQHNPVLATPVAGRWLILDGHHRVTALRAAGVGAALVQHVELDETVHIGSWTHELSGPVVAPPPAPSHGRRVARLISRQGEYDVLAAGTDLRRRVTAMWQLAGRYADQPYRRITRHDPWARGATCRIEYGRLSANDCLLLVELGLTLPPGVTRFQVPGRILNVRAPLDQLADAGADPRLAERLAARLRAAARQQAAGRPVGRPRLLGRPGGGAPWPTGETPWNPGEAA
jgi:L-serine kinase (ATP) / ParB family transcriptional regulator, heme-responsive regulator